MHLFIFIRLGEELLNELNLGISLIFDLLYTLIDAIISVLIVLILHIGIWAVSLLTSLIIKSDVLIPLYGSFWCILLYHVQMALELAKDYLLDSRYQGCADLIQFIIRVELVIRVVND